MIDAEAALELQPALCIAIASLIEDEHDAIVSTRPLSEFGPLAERLERLGADITMLAGAMAVIARRMETEEDA